MLAYIAIAALFASTGHAQDDFEDFDNQEEVFFYEEENEEEIALSEEESEYQDLIFFEDEGEIAEEFLTEE